jgi:hypothetical protein
MGVVFGVPSTMLCNAQKAAQQNSEEAIRWKGKL